jgi:hypothetical protein
METINVLYRARNINDKLETYENYIVFRNEKLEKENITLKLKLKKLIGENDDLELKLYSIKESKHNFIIILKTLLYLNNLKKSIIENKEIIISKTNSNIVEYISKANNHIYYLKFIMFIFLCIFYEYNFFNKINFSITCFLILFNIAFTQNMINNLSIPKFSKEKKIILENENKIKDIDSKQNYIYEYIDIV